MQGKHGCDPRERLVDVDEPHLVYAVRSPFVDRNGFRMSIGTGKMVVELFSEAISTRVCRKRSWRAIGCFAVIAAASESRCAAWYSAPAPMTLARRPGPGAARWAIT